jgi:hypothetical protein
MGLDLRKHLVIAASDSGGGVEWPGWAGQNAQPSCARDLVGRSQSLVMTMTLVD